MKSTDGYAAYAADKPISPFTFDRRDVGPDDVQIDIMFCGVCHSDLHTARNEWGGTTMYPVVPGHEIVGRVAAIGSNVTAFKKNDVVGVGCLVDSCQQCSECDEGLEQFCLNEATGTYNSIEKQTGNPTRGGYSQSIVVDYRFVLRIPDALDPAAAAPLLCAGITTFSPLRHWNVGKGHKVGVVGLGGLGHMAVKLAHAMGAHVVLFTTSPDKREDALRLGADEVVISRNADEMAAHNNSLHFILNTVSAQHDLDQFLIMLKRDGVMTLVGAPAEPHPSPSVFALITNRRSLAGSPIGGIRETQEMLDFCAANNIASDIEMIEMSQINDAYERMLKGDVRYRFVIDIGATTGW